MKNRNALVILSGGQDSTTCLFWALQNFDKVVALTIDYGQRHHREIEAAKTVVEMAGPRVVAHEFIKLGSVLRGSSPLVSDNQLEQYPDMYSLPGGLEKTFVPGRNALFMVLAMNVAWAHGITDLVTGVCQEDFGGYPDCRQTFVDAMQQALSESMDHDIRIHTPLMNLTKAQTVQMAYSDPQCWAALAFTHTSYDGQYPPLGHDHATLLRAKGFVEAGLPDPLVLRAHHEGLMALPETANYDAERAS